jgi:hypothetical protein
LQKIGEKQRKIIKVERRQIHHNKKIFKRLDEKKKKEET